MIVKSPSTDRFGPSAAFIATAFLVVASPSPQSREADQPIDRLDTPALALAAPERGVILDIVALAPNGGAEARLVAVGDRGRILFSDDAGRSWRQAASPASVELTAVAFNAGGVGVAVGHDGAILRSEDAGATWRRVADGRALFPDVVAAAQARVAAAEAALATAEESDRDDAEFALDDEIFRFETAETATAFGPAWPFLDVIWSGSETLWAIGAYGLAFQSTTAGADWAYASDVFDNPEDFHLYSMMRTRAGALVTVGEAGVIFRSDDDGASWERFDSDDGASLFGLAEIGAPGATTLVAYGFGDGYQISQDDGQTWERRDLGVEAILIGHVSEDPVDTVRAVGASGRMFELGVDGVVSQTQPLGDRTFLSGGVALAEADGDALLLATESGLRFAGEDAR